MGFILVCNGLVQDGFVKTGQGLPHPAGFVRVDAFRAVKTICETDGAKGFS